MKNKIRKFIQDNDLSFEPGSRNSTMVTLMGYAQHLGLSKDELEEELKEEMGVESPSALGLNRLSTIATY